MQALPDKVQQEQVKLIYKQLPIVIIGSYVAAVALVVIGWGQIEQHLLITWSILFTVVALARMTLNWCYWRQGAHSEWYKVRWDILFFIGAGLAGSLWATAGITFYIPEKPEIILFMVVLLAGLISSCGASSGAYMPAFSFFAVPAAIPFAIRLIADGRNLFVILGLLMIFFLGICFVFVRTYHNNTLLLIRAQFENQDLLEQLRAEKRSAENSQRIAEQAMVEKNQFLAAASHDLRQPLHALGLFVGVLRRESAAAQQPLLDSIQDSLGALNHLFNSLLDVSRLDAGVVHADAKHTNLDEVVERLRAQYRAQVEERGLEFDVDCKSLVVYSDGMLLERVLRNLLVNAINYTDRGKIAIHCRAAENRVEICVSDTGIGIPADQTEAIFSEYYQLNNPERDRNKGLGLGLAIVRRLCELMDIPLSVKSTVAQGTRFYLQVASGQPELIDVIASDNNRIPIYDLAIIVIDDEQSVLQGMGEILSGWGCRLLLAESADDAIEQITRTDFVPDIIFSDFRLRENKTGIEAIEAIYEELNLQIPAVLITGDTSAELLKQAVVRGFHLLHKPVLPDSLNKALAQWVNSDRLGDKFL